MYFYILENQEIMIDIDKFEALANEIVENASVDDMKNWFDGYRNKQACFKNFKPIAGFFKSNTMDEIKVDDKMQKTNSNRYSLAA